MLNFMTTFQLNLKLVQSQMEGGKKSTFRVVHHQKVTSALQEMKM